MEATTAATKRRASLAVTIQTTSKVIANWLSIVACNVGSVSLVLSAMMAVHQYMDMVSYRRFLITFDEAGRISDPSLAHFEPDWTYPAWIPAAVPMVVAMSFFVIGQYWIRSVWDLNNAFSGMMWAVTLGSFITALLKRTVGGLSPSFLRICKPLLIDPYTNMTRFNSTRMTNRYYSFADIEKLCAQRDRRELQRAVTSFPSYHATATFAAFGFLFLWLNAKLKIWANRQPCYLNMLAAVLVAFSVIPIAASLAAEGSQHWNDVYAGAFISTAMALAAYRNSYAAVWDWRYNHVPLQSPAAFKYGTKKDAEYARILTNASAARNDAVEVAPELTPAVGPVVNGAQPV